MASVLSMHGDNNGLVLPFTLAPIQVIIVPFYSKKSDEKIKNAVKNIRAELLKEYIDVEIDDSDLVMENFETIDAMATFVENCRNQ